MLSRAKGQLRVSHPAARFSQPHTEPISLVAVVLHQLVEREEDLGCRDVVPTVLRLPQLVVLDPTVVQHWGHRVDSRVKLRTQTQNSEPQPGSDTGSL